MVSERGAKIAAGRLHITVDAYRRHEANGERWCPRGRHWEPAWATSSLPYCPPCWNAYNVALYHRRGRSDQSSFHREPGISYAGPAFSSAARHATVAVQGTLEMGADDGR